MQFLGAGRGRRREGMGEERKGELEREDKGGEDKINRKE